MKIKVKDEMDKIKLKVSHQELIIMLNALNNYRPNQNDIVDLNNELFDKDEVTISELYDKIHMMINGIDKKISKINVY